MNKYNKIDDKPLYWTKKACKNNIWAYLIPSNPSSEPFIVNTGARAYALATRRFLSNTITFAHISSSICVHLSNTSCMWSCNEKKKIFFLKLLVKLGKRLIFTISDGLCYLCLKAIRILISITSSLEAEQPMSYLHFKNK